MVLPLIVHCLLTLPWFEYTRYVRKLLVTLGFAMAFSRVLEFLPFLFNKKYLFPSKPLFQHICQSMLFVIDCFWRMTYMLDNACKSWLEIRPGPRKGLQSQLASRFIETNVLK